jgi:hypothetical protein
MPPEVAELTVHPAPAPSPVLPCRLLPPLSEQLPGTAAPFYADAFMALRQTNVDDSTWRKMQSDWINGPLEEVPRQEAEAALARFEPVFRSIDRAARRATYGWEYPPSNYMQVIRTLETKLSSFRTLGRLILLRTRLQILRGEHEAAIRSLQTGYVMARHLAEQPTMLNALGGIAIAGVMNHGLRDLIQAPGAPNLYWALTALPSPMFDLQPALDFESATLRRMFPEFESATQGGYTPQQWAALYARIVGEPAGSVAAWRSSAEPPSSAAAVLRKVAAGTVMIAAAYPKAREILEARGFSEPELEAMSHAEVAVRGVFHAYQAQCHQMAKWCRVPYWQAEAGIEQARAEAEELGQVGLLPLAQGDAQGTPADLRHGYSAATRLQRHLAGLRCVEAIRLYAAEHYEAPKRADETAGRPAPVNPFTGTYDARLPLAWDEV